MDGCKLVRNDTIAYGRPGYFDVVDFDTAKTCQEIGHP
jgi:hypothetical protein